MGNFVKFFVGHTQSNKYPSVFTWRIMSTSTYRLVLCCKWLRCTLFRQPMQDHKCCLLVTPMVWHGCNPCAIDNILLGILDVHGVGPMCTIDSFRHIAISYIPFYSLGHTWLTHAICNLHSITSSSYVYKFHDAIHTMAILNVQFWKW
jgi:hypothetical protein